MARDLKDSITDTLKIDPTRLKIKRELKIKKAAR